MISNFESRNNIELGTSQVFDKATLPLIESVTLVFDNEVSTTIPKEALKRVKFLGSRDYDFTDTAYTSHQEGGFVRLEIVMSKWERHGIEMAYGKNSAITLTPHEMARVFNNRQISSVKISFNNGSHVISNFLTKRAFEELQTVDPEADNILHYAKQNINKCQGTRYVQIKQ